ncbi:PAS domain S-box [Desulfosporosinus orientis DSM 765]|uniref:PAS domain S-box n=1 Tax=Desulfosporosinus orientis (strain ATCC 19365 / DSM 765 / NCIMB 8382 / VKM B-1628 / Singapore I) TaxID=768706 RepID=G7WC24_DESOD|nr:sigma-54-dependent Fis family transcriptional regulator [Desulfosporosinus orientis]AET69998.1 PAS domain S-box [Desulfosporosinus orientis DSM 765]
MAEILFISPLQELASLVKEVTNQEGAPEIDIKVARMEDGVRAALEAEQRGYHVLVSRGVTAWMIREAGVTLPVIDVRIGGLDILEAYLQAKSLGSLIGIVDVNEMIQEIASFEELIGESFVKYTLKDQKEDILKGVAALKAAKVQVVIGKIAMANEAKKLGMQAVVIRSGREAVQRALAEARRVLEVRKLEKRRVEQLRAILDFTYDGVIALDEEGRISVFNPVAAKLTGWTAEKAIGRSIDDVLLKCSCRNILKNGKAEVGDIMEIGRSKVVANHIPIKVDQKVEGVVTTFQSIDRLQSLEHKVRRTLADRGHVAKHSFNDILGHSQAVKDAIKWAREYAQVDSTVLLRGRTGSGKELFAQAIHNASPRRRESFVAINCAALPENLLESELFGYVEGAFTGARKGGKAGVFEIAHGGTLFLDEVGEMATSLQARLLRVLEEGEVMRLGDNRVLPVNVRLVAATHRDLKEMVEIAGFREDLFYRLNVLSLVVPELAERGDDILLIARHFLGEFCRRMNRSIGSFSRGAELILLEYPWPGNIRELRNAMERLVMLTGEKEISEEDVVRALMLDGKDRKLAINVREKEVKLRGEVEFAEIRLIQKVLKECGGNKTETARRLGISRTTLWRKIQDAGLEVFQL